MNDPYLVRHLLKNVKFALLFVALIVFFIGGGVASVLIYGRYNAARELTSGKASLPTDTGLSASQNTISQQLTVNAPLVVNNHFVLTPSALPQTGQAGQLVFDKDTNRLKYYDGTQFVDIAATTSTTTVQGQAGIVTLLAGSGIAVNGSTITNNGIIDILSTPNGIGVSVSGGTATLSLPQALDTSASPTFAGVTVSGAGGGNLTLGTAATLFGNMIQQTSSGQNVTINAGTDNITFTAGGRDFVFPTSGPASQTICTTGVTCVAGGGQAVLLAPGSAQTDTTSDVSIFVNDTGGGNLLQLQNGSADKFIVASNGDTTVGGILHANTITPTSTFTVGSLTQQFALQGSNTSTISARSGANTTTVGFVSPTASATINFPALSAGTYQLCTTSGNCLGAGGGANASLSNLSSVAINTSLLTGAATIDLGSNAAPFRDLYLGGTGTNNIKFTGTASAARTITVPDASGTLAVSASGNIALSAAGNITFSGVLPIANGGTNSSSTATAGAVAYGTGSAYGFTTAGTSSQVLISNGASAPSFTNIASLLANGTNISITGGSMATIGTTANPTFSTSVTTPLLQSAAALAITPGGALTVGATGQTFTLQGAGASTITATNAGSTTTVGFTTPTANTTLNFPALTTGTYTICTTSGNCLGGGAGGANTALSNLASVAINTSLLPGATTIDLGAGATPFRDLYIGGSATNNFKFTGTATGARTITVPDASGTLAVSATGNIALSGAGNLTFTGTLPIANGGTNGSATPTAGGVAYGTGSAYAFTSAGTSSQVLISGGAGAASFSNIASLLAAGTNINVTGTTVATIATTANPTFATSVTTPLLQSAAALTITPGGAFTIGATSQQFTLQGNGSSTLTATDSGNKTTVAFTTPTANTTLNFPALGAGTYDICTSSGNCGGGGGGANTALSNLSGVAINTALLPGTTTIDLGSNSFAFRDLYIGGTATNNFKLTGTATAARTITFPDDSGTVCLDTGNCAGGGGSAPTGADYLTLSANGTLTNERTATAGTNISFVDGGANSTLTISTTANPTFATSVTTPLLQSAGAMSITPGGALTVGATSQTFTLQGDGASTITASASGNKTTVAFATPTANTTLNFPALSAGTYTVCTSSGNCAGAGVTLQSAYDNSGSPATITTSSGAKTVLIVAGGGNDSASLFQVQNAAGNSVFSVDSSSNQVVLGKASSVTGKLTFQNSTNGNTTSLTPATATGSRTVTIPDASGTLAVSASGNIALSAAGDITFTGTLPIASGGTNGTATPTAGGLSYGTGTAYAFTSAGTSNQVAISGGAGAPSFTNISTLLSAGTNISITGTTTATVATTANPTFATSVTTPLLQSSAALTITPGGALTVGATSQAFTLQGTGSSTITATSSGNTTTIGFVTPSANTTINYPALTTGTYTVCTTSGNCLGGGSGGANTALSNLASVAINTSLLPGATTIDLGAGATPFRDLYLGGTATNNFKFTGTASAARTLTLPDASGTLAVSATGNIALSAAGNISFTGLLPIANGGTNAATAPAALANLGAAASGSNSDITATTALNTITPSSSLTVGATTQQFTLQGLSTSTITGKSGSFTTTLGFTTPTANRSINLPDAGGTICTDSGNCAGAGGTLQTSYNNSTGGTTPEIKLDSTRGGLDIQDANSALGTSLFNVRASNGAGLGTALLSVASSGTTISNLLTGQLGATISGAVTSINASSNFATNINTGTSTGAVAIGNSAAGAITMQSASTIGLTGTTTITGLTSGDALNVSNSTSTGNVAVFKDNSTAVVTIADGGAATFANATNSVSGFQIQNSSATTLFNVDTTNSLVTVSPELDATLSLSSPAGGIGNIGNYLNQSEDMDDSALWLETNIASTGHDSTVAPNGATTADTITASGSGTHTIIDNPNNASGAGTYTFSVWAKAGTGSQGIQLRIDSTGGTPGTGTPLSITPTSTWKRYMVTQTFTGSPSAILPVVVISNHNASVIVWGAQMQLGTSPGVYSHTKINPSDYMEPGAFIDGFLRVQEGSCLFFNTGGFNDTSTAYCAEGFSVPQTGQSFWANVGAFKVGNSSTIPGNGNALFSINSDAWNVTGSGYLLQGSNPAAATQTAALGGLSLDTSTNFTVPNSASGNQTGINLTVKDGGASATAKGIAVQGTYDRGIDLSAGTVSAGGVSILLPSTNGATGGLQFGTDANSVSLYRSANDTLRTGDAFTADGLVTGSLGATISGATTSINASSNFATNLNTGTSTGAVSIGNSAAGAIAIQSASTVGLIGTTTITGLTSGVALTVNNSTSVGNIFVAQDNGSPVFTIADGGAVTATSTLAIQGASVTVGAAAVQGSVILFDGSGGQTATIQSGNLSANTVLTLPASLGVSDTFCFVTLANCSGAGSGVTTVGAFSGSSQTNGASIASTTITFGPADTTNPGMVSTGTQTFGGAKTFQSTSTAALQVQTAAGGTTLLAVDTTNLQVTIGTLGAPDAFATDSGTVPTAVDGAAYANSNGYAYLAGGFNTGGTVVTTVQMAKISTSGALTWSTLTTTPLPTAVANASAVVANGYLYVFGGNNSAGSTMYSTVYYSRINGDGTLAGWNTTTGLPTARAGMGAVFANGFIYSIGGQTNSGVPDAINYVAKVNANGTISNWTSTTAQGTATRYSAVVTANNYIYNIGGTSNAGSRVTTTQYAPIDPVTGLIGTWGTTNTYSATAYEGLVADVVSGTVYVMGGNQVSTNGTRDISYATLNANGTTGSFTTVSNALPAARGYGSTFTANGYLYYMTGTTNNSDANASTTVYYASVAGRLKVNGPLDLVGGTTGTLADPGSGSSLIAGNTNVVGRLQVEGSTTLAGGVNIQGNANINGDVSVQSQTDSSTAFQIQSASNTSILAVSTLSANKNLIASPSFEGGIPGENSRGWYNNSSGAVETLAITASGTQSGSQAMQITTVSSNSGGSATQGAKYYYEFKPNTTYTFSVYASVSSGTMTNFELGHVENFFTSSTCLTGQTLTTTVTRYSCSFTTASTFFANGQYVFLQRNTTGVYNIRIDAVQLEVGSAATAFAEPPYPNLIGNPDMESTITGWEVRQVTGSPSISVSTDAALYGNRSLKLVTSTSPTNGAQYNVQLSSNTRYSLSLWARRDTSSAASFNIGHEDIAYGTGTICQGANSSCNSNGTVVTGTGTTFTAAMVGSEIRAFDSNGDVSLDDYIVSRTSNTVIGVGTSRTLGGSNVYSVDVDTDCLTNQTLTTTWTQFTCTFTTGTTGDDSAIYIKQTDSSSDTIYVDGVTLTASGSAQTYVPPAASLQVEPLYNTVQINSGYGGELQPWQTNRNWTPNDITNTSTVAAKGYIYEIGGLDGGATTHAEVYFAKLNADGSTGTWYQTSSLPDERDTGSAVYANGYIYYLGGEDNATVVKNTVYYARILPDGTLGSWQTSSNTLVNTVFGHSSVYLNGYLYVIGGDIAGHGLATGDHVLWYAKVNADGSTGSWIDASVASSPNMDQGFAATWNGRIYATGFAASSAGVYVAQPNSDGTPGTWTLESSTNCYPNCGRIFAGGGIMNGYMYSVGGEVGGVEQTNVYSAKINDDGTLGFWQTNSSPLPDGRAKAGFATYNGYMYLVGGKANSAFAVETVFYTSGPRTTVTGSLDLVGSSGGTLADSGGNGGTLTAGNTTIVGDLQVAGSSLFATANVTGSLTTGSLDVNLKGGADKLKVTQSNIGNATIQVINSADTYSLGIYGGASGNNHFRLSSATAAAGGPSTGIIGNTTLGGGSDNNNGGWMVATKFNSGNIAGSATQMSVYLGAAGGSDHAKVAIYTHNSSANEPSTLIANSSSQVITANSLNTFTISASINADTTYWLVVYLENNSTNYPVDVVTDYVTYMQNVGSYTSFPTTFTQSFGPSEPYSLEEYLTVTLSPKDELAYGLMDVSDTGQTTFRNSSNSTTAFQIQNASGSNLFNVNTSIATNLITNGDFEATIAQPWNIKNGSTIGQNTSNHVSGNASLNVATAASTGSGAAYYYSLAASTQYTVSFYAKVSTGSMSTMAFGPSSDDGLSDNSCSTGNSLSTTWQYFTCTFTMGGSVSGTRSVYVKQTDATARTIYIDRFQLETGATATGFTPGGSLQVLGYLDSPLTIQVAQNVPRALEVNNAAGNNIFTVDTVNNKVGTADTTGASTNSQALLIQSGSASGTTSNSGSVTLDSGSATGTAGNISIGTGAYSHNTTIGNTTGTSTLTLQAGTGNASLAVQNSQANAFIIKQSSTNYFNVDTSAVKVQIGSSTSDATGILLVLDSLNTAADPTGVNGAMYYNSSLAKFRCYENSAWRNCGDPVDLKNGYYVYEDFLSSASGTDNIGTYGWSKNVSGTGAAINNPDPTAADDHYGYVQLDTGTTNTGLSQVRLNSIGSYVLGGSETAEMSVRLPTLSTAGQEYVARFGFGDATGGGENVDGIYFEYDRAAHGTSWFCGTSSNSSRTESTASTTVTANTWTRLRFEVNSAGTSVTYYINGSSVCTISTNIPTVATLARRWTHLLSIEKTAGTTNSLADIDYYQFTRPLGTSR